MDQNFVFSRHSTHTYQNVIFARGTRTRKATCMKFYVWHLLQSAKQKNTKHGTNDVRGKRTRRRNDRNWHVETPGMIVFNIYLIFWQITFKYTKQGDNLSFKGIWTFFLGINFAKMINCDQIHENLIQENECFPKAEYEEKCIEQVNLGVILTFFRTLTHFLFRVTNHTRFNQLILAKLNIGCLYFFSVAMRFKSSKSRFCFLKVARIFNRSKSVIDKLWAKYNQTGTVVNRRRRPRRRVTTRRQDRYIVLSHLRNRQLTAASTARNTIGIHNRPVSRQTIINRLREGGIRARRPMKAPILYRRHKAARLAWARRHLRFTRADWANVLFVDETKINLNGSDGRDRVYRRRGERANDNCIVETQRFGGGSILVWAGISMHSKTPIVRVNGNLNARRYQTDIIAPVLIPHVRANRGLILAQDNAPCHAARTTQQLLRANNIRVLPWPSCSPDLNPIEHVWDLLKRRQRKLPKPNNLVQLELSVRRVWGNIGQGTIQNYIGSMRRRCQAVINAQGGHTKY